MEQKKQKYFPFILFFVFVMFGIMTFLCHRALQNESVYKIISPIIRTYAESTDDKGNRSLWLEKKPFDEITVEKTHVWDSDHYNKIKESLYGSDIDHLANYAFFPLFPLVWKAVGLDGIQICIFNWILFCIGMLLMYYIFKDKIKHWAFFLALLVPMNVVYMIPYTEGLFFLCIAAGLYGMIKNNYPLYFIGFLLASMTKSSATVFFAVFTCAEIIAFLHSRDRKQSAVNYIKRLLPIILGVFFVMVFQKLNGSPRWFFFVEVQKFWGKYLSLPSLPFTDWSEEGRYITLPMLIMYFLPCTVVVIRKFILSLKQKDPQELSSWEYVRYVCLLYFIGNIFVALLTQHGSLNSVARYILCTPFFVFLLFDTVKRTREKKRQAVYLIIGIITVVICLPAFSKPNTLGIYLVMAGSLLAFFHHNLPKQLSYSLMTIAILFNILWSAYLFNCFISNGWIFT